MSEQAPMSILRLQPRRGRPTSVPQKGDTHVTLRVDPNEHDLESRMQLLSYAFAKTIQGAVLRTVLVYDLIGGRVEFIVGGGAMNPGPEGVLTAELRDWPVETDVKTIR